MCSLGRTLLAFALLHSVLQSQTFLLLQVSLEEFLPLLSNPYDEKHTPPFFFLVLVLEGLVGVHKLFNFSFFGISGWDIDLDYCDVEWFALERRPDHSVILGVTSKYCILDSFVDHDGYSISSKGFLPVVVDIMVI